MAFTAKILSWRFRHLNIVGCLLKRRPTKGGHGHTRIPPPSHAPGLSPTPSVSNLSLRPCRYLSTVTRSSSRGSVDGFRRERLQRFATFDSLSVQRRLEARLRVVPHFSSGIVERAKRERA